MRRYLVLDLGLKRTGIALADDENKVATPISVIKAAPTSRDFINSLNDLVNEWEPEALVFGLPIDLKGKEAIAAQNVRELSEKIILNLENIRQASIENALGVHYFDERLTTAQSERLMKDAGASSKSRAELRDALAAAVIAQSFINSL